DWKQLEGTDGCVCVCVCVLLQLLLSGDEMLQVASAQCMAAVLVHSPSQYCPQFIQADLPGEPNPIPKSKILSASVPLDFCYSPILSCMNLCAYGWALFWCFLSSMTHSFYA